MTRPVMLSRAKHLALALTLVAVALSGCKSLRRGPKGAALPDTVIEVENHSYPDVVMYVVTGGSDPWRLGMVSGNGTGKFTVRSSLVVSGTLQLLARPIAGTAYRLPTVSISPGDIVEVVLESTPGQAHISVSRPEPE